MKKSTILIGALTLAVLMSVPLIMSDMDNASAASFTLTYDANGGSGAPDGGTYSTSTEIIAKGAPTVAKSGYVFVKWNANRDGTGLDLYPGNKFIINTNTVFYAIWGKEAGTAADFKNLMTGNTTEIIVIANSYTIDNLTMTSSKSISSPTFITVKIGAGKALTVGAGANLIIDGRVTLEGNIINNGLIWNKGNIPSSTGGKVIEDEYVKYYSAVGYIPAVFANGNPIKIENGTKYSKISIGTFNNGVPGNWATVIENRDLSEQIVVGGFKDASATNTYVEVTGGNVMIVNGGGYSLSDKAANVTKSTVNISGGTVNSAFGGTFGYGTVSETNVNVTGGTVTFIAGGGNDKLDCSSYTTLDKFKSVTASAKVNVSGGTCSYIFGGGLVGLTRVNTATVNVSGGSFKAISAGGCDGMTDNSTLNVSGATVVSSQYLNGKYGLISAAHMGAVGTAQINVSGKINVPNDGGILITPGALTFKPSDTDASLVNPNAFVGKVDLTVTSSVTNAKMLLGIGVGGVFNKNLWMDKKYTLEDSDITISAPGKTVYSQDLNKSNAVVSSNYIIGAGKTLKLGEDTTLEVANGSTVTNKGRFDNRGLLNITGTLNNDGVINDFILIGDGIVTDPVSLNHDVLTSNKVIAFSKSGSTLVDAAVTINGIPVDKSAFNVSPSGVELKYGLVITGSVKITPKWSGGGGDSGSSIVIPLVIVLIIVGGGLFYVLKFRMKLI